MKPWHIAGAIVVVVGGYVGYRRVVKPWLAKRGQQKLPTEPTPRKPPSSAPNQDLGSGILGGLGGFRDAFDWGKNIIIPPSGKGGGGGEMDEPVGSLGLKLE